MDHQLTAAGRDIGSYDGNRLLNTPTDDLTPYFSDKYKLEVPVIHKDRAYVDQREGKVPVIDYFARGYDDDRVCEVTPT
jgi:hypothetical protein